MKLFSGRCSAFSDESLCLMPGFSHRSQPEKVRVCWYPFEEHMVRFWVFARNRSHALKQLRHVANVRDLDSGIPSNAPESILKLLAPNQ